MRKQLGKEFVDAAKQNQNVEVFIKRIAADPDVDPEPEDVGLDTLSPFGKLAVNDIKGVVNEGEWLRVRNGITMDSGSAVMVMPSGWLQMFQLRESEGSKRGQTYVAAAKDGKPIVNEGEKTIKFFTKPDLESERRQLTCQVAAVNKMLASIAGFCDAGNDVIFRKHGGEIINLSTNKRTPFKRLGNIYVMDAYIPNPDFIPQVDAVSQGFPRPRKP